MNNDQAQRFAMRMVETWPTGPRRNVWLEVALGCDDPDAAKAAYATLERAVSVVSVAAFRAEYAKAAAATLFERPERCEMCDGTGFVTAPDRVVLKRDGTTRSSSAVEPCLCTIGQKRRDMVGRNFGVWV